MLIANRILIVLSLIIVPVAAKASPVFTLANEAYQNKNFPQAIDLYRESLKISQSFSQYFNLGNAYYQNKEYGQAVLYFEKALSLDPGNADASKNLQKTYSLLKIQHEQPGVIELFTDIFSAYTWTWITVVVVLIGFGSFSFLLYINNDSIFLKTTMWSCSLLCILLICINIFYVDQTRWGVVLKNEAPLKISPTSASPVTTQLLEGTKAKSIKTKEKVSGYILVKTPNNKEGWISTDDFGLIW